MIPLSKGPSCSYTKKPALAPSYAQLTEDLMCMLEKKSSQKTLKPEVALQIT